MKPEKKRKRIRKDTKRKQEETDKSGYLLRKRDRGRESKREGEKGR